MFGYGNGSIDDKYDDDRPVPPTRAKENEGGVASNEKRVVSFSYYSWSEPNSHGVRENWLAQVSHLEDGSRRTEPNYKFTGFS